MGKQFDEYAATTDLADDDIGLFLTGSGTRSATANTIAKYVRLSVKSFGAVGDGTTNDTDAFNALTDYLRDAQVVTGYDYAGVEIYIPPGKYSISSWDLTELLIQNVQITGYGAVLIARTAGKNVIDGLGSRFIRMRGFMVFSPIGVVARSGIQLGPKGTETCGNNELEDITVAGWFNPAAYMNLGSESMVHKNCRFLNRRESASAYAQICDGLSNASYLPTSDYVTVTRTAGTAVSFSIQAYYGCQLRSEGGGPCTYLANGIGHSYDLGCYHLTFNEAAFVMFMPTTSANRSRQISIKGSFETYFTDLPSGSGNTGMKWAVKFTNEGSNTALVGFEFESSIQFATVAVFDNAGTGFLRISDARIKVDTIDGPLPGVMFGNSGGGGMAIDGVFMTQSADKANFGTLTTFSGSIYVNDYSALASVPAGGWGVITDRVGSIHLYGTPQVDTIHIGNSDTTLARFGSGGDISVEGNRMFRVGGTDVPIADGGTGASTDRAACAALGAAYLLASSETALSHTGDTSETQMAAISIPAGAMGANGELLLLMEGACTNSANTKQPRVRLGAIGTSAFAPASYTTQAYWRSIYWINNANSQSSQYGSQVTNRQTDGLQTAVTGTTTAIDTASAQDLLLTLQNANSGETSTILRYSLWLIYKA